MTAFGSQRSVLVSFRPLAGVRDAIGETLSALAALTYLPELDGARGSPAEAARHTAQNVARYLRGEPVEHVVDPFEYGG